MATELIWPGFKGNYRYWFADTPRDAMSLKAEAGNYMFVKLTPQGWVPVYIGIADNLATRIAYHDRWDDAVRAGAIRVMGHTEASAAKRQAEERDLIAYWNPVLNTQHRLLPRGLGG